MADKPKPEQTSPNDTHTRSWIAGTVVIFSLIVTAALGITAIVAVFPTNGEANLEKKFGYIKDILAIILPLVGTWVGTVLAYYFSRENFEAAARHTEIMYGKLTPEQRLQSIAVTDVMLNMDAATTITLSIKDLEEAKGKKLEADVIDAILKKNNVNRLPIVEEATGKVLYIVHRSEIDKFLAKTRGNIIRDAVNGAGNTIPSLTAEDVKGPSLHDLLTKSERRVLFVSFGVVSNNAKLNAVKQIMDDTQGCDDVFVTEDGTRESRAIGWITDKIVQEKSSA